MRDASHTGSGRTAVSGRNHGPASRWGVAQRPSLGYGWVRRRAARGVAPLRSRTDSEVISPAAMAGGKTGLVLCQVGGQ